MHDAEERELSQNILRSCDTRSGFTSCCYSWTSMDNCVEVPESNNEGLSGAELVCETSEFSQSTCESIGCCNWNNGQC